MWSTLRDCFLRFVLVGKMSWTWRVWFVATAAVLRRLRHRLHLPPGRHEAFQLTPGFAGDEAADLWHPCARAGHRTEACV